MTTRDNGTAGWVKWAVGVAVPVIMALAGVVINDHTELAVLRDSKSKTVERQLANAEQMATLLQRLIEQHQTMIGWQDRMLDAFQRAPVDAPVLRGPTFQRGRMFDK